MAPSGPDERYNYFTQQRIVPEEYCPRKTYPRRRQFYAKQGRTFQTGSYYTLDQQRSRQKHPPPVPSLKSPTNCRYLQPAHSRALQTEHTRLGQLIVFDNNFESQNIDTLWACSDAKAAYIVREHFQRTQSLPDNQHERILRGLVDSPETIDDLAIYSIMSAANHVFFAGRLSGRVDWEWSQASQPRYETELVGSTALRYARPSKGGIETLIVLSRPILDHPDIDRRLLLCAILHELIHCYLFIQCGFDARIRGGHTDAFEAIARIIDTWVGVGRLQLCDMKANLDHFRKRTSLSRGHRHPGCSQSPPPGSDYAFFVGTGREYV